MPNSNTSNKVNLHSRSKQIKKQKNIIRADDDYSPAFSDASDKKYKTYTKSQKISIVSDLRKALWPHNSHNNSSPDHFIDHLDTLSKDRYNQVIESILSSHAPSALKYKGDKKQWQKELKQWRRQLKSWVKNVGKPETRGNIRVVPQAKVAEFKQRMIGILQSMPSRSFDLLREKTLAALKEMHENGNDEEEQDPRCVVNESTFSKHFWYDYMRANPDIEELYSALPICRNTAKKNVFTEEEIVPRAKGDNIESPSALLETKTQGSENFSLDEDHFEEYCKYFAEEGLFNEDTCFTTTAVIQVPEEEKEEVSQPLMFSDLDHLCDSETAGFDFYKFDKMIVESEDNEVQMDYFKQFCLHGMDI